MRWKPTHFSGSMNEQLLMCIIVDASRMGDFINPKHHDSAPIRNWLQNGGRLVFSTGGRFTEEVGKSNKYKQKLVEYSRSGRAELIPCESFASDEEFLKNSNLLNSNDPHVLALARHTGTRLLYTRDFKLIQDFKNSKVINKPRGKVYSNSTNADLLTGTVCAKLQASTPRN